MTKYTWALYSGWTDGLMAVMEKVAEPPGCSLSGNLATSVGLYLTSVPW